MIPQLLEAFFSSGVLHLVLEFCQFDLEKVIRDKGILLKAADIKSYLQMTLRGVQCCHRNFVLHRGESSLHVLLVHVCNMTCVEILSLRIY